MPDSTDTDTREATEVAEVNAKKIRGRRSTKRSRTGCLTCKFRKVKCDEKKPECDRCITFGIGCDGYEKPKHKFKSSTQPLLPSHPTHYKLLPAPSGTLQFESELEESYFNIFQNETASEISGTFPNAFWDRVVLQACHEERFVLRAVTALSAFNTYLKLARDPDQSHYSRSLLSQHTDFALAQYQNALQTMRGSLSLGRNPRKALIACLLVCAFEGLVGNTLTALAHARSGQKLLEEWLGEYEQSKSYVAGISSPAPHIVEDQLIQAAGFFETQIIGFFDHRPVETHAIMKTEGSETIRLMPSTFRDLEEARRYWDLMARRIMHFLCEISAKGKNVYKLSQQGPDDDDTVDLGSDLTHRAHGTPLDVLADFKSEQMRYSQEIARWRSAFSDLYSKIKRSSNRRLITGAHTLHVKARGLDIGLAGGMDTTNCAFDKHFTEFRDIVTISREIIRAKKSYSKAEFTFEYGILPALHITAKWCRDRVVRREAIEIMEWYGAREGHWDSVVFADIDRCLMNLEEDGIEEDFVPERARVRITSLKANQGGRWASMEYIRGSRRTGEVRGEVRLEWARYVGNSPATQVQVNGMLRIPRGQPSTLELTHT
ncbi:uncharacterized protein LY89DRAFT_742860 [Mollisia scopiformis]|uniref:Zn(2)-C6 fungal-type domain-containing protein n=1 Tax=Mollisia scopiformis TaxID=149040 RepID=A0A132B5F2_MOLSC|nr:uncharacterized protein LY89DRAFT_742860 [Mollisia scopiformis]KUJ07632.1 hypothetical protein LY89DRAFT_742860 [Mollisia scopiformis]